MNKIVVADASPLIGFARINQLTLLHQLFNTVVIPEAVALECLAEPHRPGAMQIQAAISQEIIKIDQSPLTISSTHLTDILGAGETAAIQLALAIKAILLLDDKLGRRAAQNLEIPIIGTAGILILAKQHKIIDAVKPLILQLQAVGYYLSKELIKAVLKQVHET